MKYSRAVKLSAILSLITPLAGQADWVRVFDLEDTPVTNDETALQGEGWIFQDYDFAGYPDCETGVTDCTGVRKVVEAPFGGNGKALSVIGTNPEVAETGNARAIVAMQLPAGAEIPSGGIGTVYLRVAAEDLDIQSFFGLTVNDAPSNGSEPDTVHNYSDFGPAMGMVVSADSGTGTETFRAWDVYNTGFWAAATDDDNLYIEAGVWYEIWFEITNAPVNQGGGYTNLYIRGGRYADPSADPLWAKDYLSASFDDWGFRKVANEDLSRFLIVSNGGTTASTLQLAPLYFDDLYVAVGEHVISGNSSLDIVPPLRGSSVVVPKWAGFDVMADGRTVDTGDFLGMVDVANDPWIFIYDLGTYSYLPEANVGEAGGWMYLPR